MLNNFLKKIQCKILGYLQLMDPKNLSTSFTLAGGDSALQTENYERRDIFGKTCRVKASRKPNPSEGSDVSNSVVRKNYVREN